jgi:Spy/CpxP family protein refolding chaperone
MVNNWKIILPTCVIFGAGLLAGGLTINRIDRCNGVTSRQVVPTVANSTVAAQIRREPGGMDQHRIEFMRTVSSNLNLTAEQRVCVDKTLREGQECIEKLWKEFNPKTREVLNNCRSKIIADLTPEQRDQFNQMMKRAVRKPEDSATNRPTGEVR